MSLVEVRALQIWGNHIHGNIPLRYRIFRMQPGELIELEVEGHSGHWEKMEANQTTGELTQGLKPLGKARRHWHNLCRERLGDLVQISPAQPRQPVLSLPEPRTQHPSR